MAKISRSREDYLEAILIQTKKNGACRITDVARQLGFSKPSVSVAISKLEEEGYVIRDDWRILLSDEGNEIAQCMLDKHSFFAKWLIRLGIRPDTAQNEACLIEHAISYETYEIIVAYLKSVDPEL